MSGDGIRQSSWNRAVDNIIRVKTEKTIEDPIPVAGCTIFTTIFSPQWCDISNSYIKPIIGNSENRSPDEIIYDPVSDSSPDSEETTANLTMANTKSITSSDKTRVATISDETNRKTKKKFWEIVFGVFFGFSVRVVWWGGCFFFFFLYFVKQGSRFDV